jgi:hypothetical protein
MTGRLFAEERSLTQPLKQARDQATWGLFGWFVLCVIIFPLCAPKAPQPLKTLALFTGAMASLGGTAILRENAQRSKIDDSLEQMQMDALKQQVVVNASYHQVTQEINAQAQVAGWIAQNVPQHLWMVFGQKYGVGEFFIPPQPQVIEAEYEEVAPLAIPAALYGQESLSREQAAEVARSLNIEWFKDWSRRSGIVCGESGDGKSFLLTNIVLADFVRQHGMNGKVYICDPDYGSAHEGQEPNTWLDLIVGTHIYIEAMHCYSVITAVSREIDRRAQATAQAVSQKQPRPVFEPMLLIADEVPMLMSQWSEEQQKTIVEAIANILRRGIKQNVTSKIGTQTLAVGRLKLNRDILQQSEMVVLWRAAQVADNYSNLGLKPKAIDEITDAIALLPRRAEGRYACVTYIGKQLGVAGIPEMRPVTSTAGAVPAQESPIVESSDTSGDAYTQIRAWQKVNPEWTDAQLVLQFTRHTGRSLNPEQLAMLKDYLNRLP